VSGRCFSHARYVNLEVKNALTYLQPFLSAGIHQLQQRAINFRGMSSGLFLASVEVSEILQHIHCNSNNNSKYIADHVFS
jgi:hypothetical protein